MTGTLTARDERSWIESVIGMADQVSDQALYDLHREVSRLATRKRQRDPEYQQRQRMGNLAARATAAR